MVTQLRTEMNNPVFAHSCLDLPVERLSDPEQPLDDDDELDRCYCFCLSVNAASKSSHSIEDADYWSLLN